MLDIVVLVLAVRHLVERQVRDLRERVVELLAEPPSPPPPSPGCRPSARATSAISACAASASSLLFLASPISFEAALRRACAASSFWIAVRRALVERDQPLPPRGASPRRASARSKASGVFADPLDVVHGRLSRRHAPELVAGASTSLRRLDAQDVDAGRRDSLSGRACRVEPTYTPLTPPAWRPPLRRAALRLSAAACFSTSRTDQIEPS